MESNKFILVQDKSPKRGNLKLQSRSIAQLNQKRRYERQCHDVAAMNHLAPMLKPAKVHVLTDIF